MTNGFVLFVSPLLDPFCQSGQRPHREPLRISCTCIESRLLRGLCVSQQMVQKFTLHGTKQPLLGRSKARFSSRTLMLAHPIEGEQLLKVHTGKFRASINGDSRRQAPVALDAEAECHHTGAVRRWVEGQVVGSNEPGVRKNEQRQPAFAQWFAGT